MRGDEELTDEEPADEEELTDKDANYGRKFHWTL